MPHTITLAVDVFGRLNRLNEQFRSNAITLDEYLRVVRGMGLAIDHYLSN